jgi:hypothetical protein
LATSRDLSVLPGVSVSRHAGRPKSSGPEIHDLDKYLAFNLLAEFTVAFGVMLGASQGRPQYAGRLTIRWADGSM